MKELKVDKTSKQPETQKLEINSGELRLKAKLFIQRKPGLIEKLRNV